MEKPERQQVLQDSYQFKCECTACVQNYPASELPRRVKKFAEPNMKFFGTIKESKAEFKRNIAYLEKIMVNHPSYETVVLLHRNSCLLIHMGSLAFCPFYQS